MRGGKCISTPDRRRLVEAHDRGDDYVVVANALGIKKDTAYRIIKRRSTESSKRGGCRQNTVKVTAEVTAAVTQMVDNNCSVTLKQITNKMYDEHNIRLSSTSINRILTGSLYSMKKMQLMPEARNSADNKRKRQVYATWFQGVSDEDFIFIDESGFDLWQARVRGRSHIGERARRVVDNQRKPHLTLILAIAPHHGVVHHIILEGGAKKENMLQFMIEVLHRSEEIGLVNPHIVIDNAPCHAHIEDSLEAEDNLQPFRLHRLPPYSCELNPIENIFHVIKSHAKQALAELDMERREGETLVAFRRRKLNGVVENSIRSATQQKITAAYRHCLARVIPRALNLDDL